MASEQLTGFRLSPQQEHLWRVWQNGGGTYRAECTVRLTGAVDASILSRALEDVVLRHEVLRTVLRRLPGLSLPLQVVLDAAPEPLILFPDTLELAADSPDLDADSRSPLRARLVSGSPGTADSLRLLLDLPAVFADLIGLENLVREIALAYAVRRGSMVERDEPIQYADVSEIFHDFLAEGDPALDRSWWHELDLSALSPPFFPPVPPTNATFRPERVRRVVPLSTVAGLGAPGDDSAPWLAAWHAVLWHLSERRPVLVGVAVDGRTYEGLDEALGLFARHLPVRSLPEGGLPFRAFADRVREDLRAAERRQELFSWEDVGGTFPPCAFEVEPRLGSHRAGGIELTVEQRSAVWDRFTLKLSLVPGEHELAAELSFDASLLRREDVERLAERFLTFAAAAGANPETPLDDLDLVGLEERELLLGLSAAPVDLGPSRTLTELWRERAHAAPHATAAVFRDRSLSYRELADRAARLARQLRVLGVGPEVRVGLAVERSLDLVVGLLAILEAGGTWVSLDPSYPRDRLAFMLEDSGASVLLTQERLRGHLPAPAGGVLCVDGEADQTEDGLPAGAEDATPEHLAYILYTSGSTGRPKGVMVTHRAITNRLLWMQRAFPLSPDDAVLQKTPYGFDASIWEIFLPLSTGALLVVAEPEGHRDPAYLAAAVADRRITVLQLVPTVLGPLLEQERAGIACRALRRLFCGGEALPAELVERFFARGGAALCNLYGPTEAAIDATFHSLVPEPGHGPASGIVPIGRPVANDEIYLLDGFRLAPWGMPGEIHIGGIGLARGYAGRPDLTAEKFLPHPWSTEPGARLYRTGDLARFRSDGVLEFLGRADQQVKIRGVRIEPGEVEATLTRHPAVREAAVTVREGHTGQPLLVAYVVPAREPATVDGNLHRLPNGLEVACLNRNEADLIYQEIFVDETYLAHGITLGDGDCVFDVGANIGLFTLFLSGRFHDLRIFAFEPIPPTFEVLRANVSLYGIDATLFPCGVAERSGQAELVFYPRWSAMSGAYADQREEEEISRVAMVNLDRRLEERSDDLLAARFGEKRVYTCRLRPLSEVIRESGVERIDLLKVDAEKSEENVLAGLLDEDWKRIAQLVIEVHDTGGRLDRVHALLAERGFSVVVDQDAPLRGTTLYNLYAVHPERVRPRPVSGGERPRPDLRRALRPVLRIDELGPFLAERLPEQMVPAVFMPLAALPLTPSGKVDRKALPAPEQPGGREGYAAPRTREEKLLVALWEQFLRLPRVGVNENFFELGGDSILSVQIAARARQDGLVFSVRQIFEHQTVAELARHVTLLEGAGARQERVVGEVPLTPTQSWFFEQNLADLEHFNQAVVLEAREPLSPAALERAMAAIVEHHDALRMRFRLQIREEAAGSWQQENAASESVVPFYQVDLSSIPASRFREAFELAAALLQAGFDLSGGPLTRLALFTAGSEQPDQLLWVTHHLVVDGVSWRILFEDLEAAYHQAARGQQPTFPPKSTSFQEWARRLVGHAGSDALARELDVWRETVRAAVPRLPQDFPSGGTATTGNRVGDEATVSFELTVEETSDLLQVVPSVYHNHVNDALLSALVRALAGWTGSPRQRVDLEGHGREPISDDLDVSRTVGWFTTLYPVVLEGGDAGPGDALVSTKERLRAVPERGIGYGLLRYLRKGDGGEEVLGETSTSEISFNYLGQVDATLDELSLFRASPASAGPARSQSAHRSHLLEIGGIVAAGRLRVNLGYSSRMYRRETAERLAAAYAAALRQLIEDSRSRADEVLTPSDFPKARLDVRSFNQVASLLSDPIESLAEGMGLTLKNVEDIYPLSALQNGLLFHSLMAPESGVYVNQFTCTLPADLDPVLLRQSWERLVQRHGALRTAFLWDGLAEPLQVVRKSVALPWKELDWRDLPADEAQRRGEELRHQDRHTPLSLGKAPLMRFSLVRLDRELAFIWTFHHLLLDGWSGPILIDELRSTFTALREGREPALPPVRPFGDYLVWLQQQDPSRAEPFWRQELAGFTAPTPLNIDRRSDPSAEAASASGHAEHGIRMDRTVTAGLQALAARHRLTLQTLTLGAWAMLLSRYSNEEDVVFGSVVSGRPAALPGVAMMIGMFINSLPVRVRVRETETLVPWLQHLQERQLARLEFEFTPLTQIQRWSEVPFGSPLFETLYAFENYPAAESDGSDGLSIDNLRSFETTNYPLSLTLVGGDQVSLNLRSDRTRVEDAAALRLLDHVVTILSGMTEGPERCLGELPLLTAAETLQLRAWNKTDVAFDLDKPLHVWIEEQADRTPLAMAVRSEDEELTYRELDLRANRLAHKLLAQGVGPESRVGVFLERSCELSVALLGILKAGAAYVPLDPDHPADRRAFQEKDAGLQLVLTRNDLSGLSTGDDDGRPGVAVAPDSPAYVLYTSGSTGRPKGAMISHRAIVNRLLWMQGALQLGPTDRVLQKTPFSFDVSVWELFWPFMVGARLVMAVPGGHRDNVYLKSAIAREGITVLHFVPSMLQLFLEEPGVEECRTLRDVVCSGEALPAELARRFAARLGEARLHNLYGPTEAAVDVTWWICGEGPEPGGIPIGRPIANTQIHVLGRGLLPLPVGVAGELYIGGVNLARGYIGRPDLTAERFLPDPTGAEPGGRVYRTGDLARRREDGAVEYLGRTDHQVKIRGARIELGEIEAALVAVPGVREAAVVVSEDRPGTRRLVAYVVGDIAADALHKSLRERLPDYMVPATFVTLSALPLTSNGKVDRKALPAPEWQGNEKINPAPYTPTQEVLAGIWAELLGLERVGTADGFFALGGHSLLATQVVSRLRDAFGVEMPLRTLFEAPRLGDLAAQIETARRAGTGLGAPAIRPVSREGRLPLSFAQERLWFIDQLEPGSTLYNMPAVLRAEGPLDAAVLALCLGEIVRRHEALRTVFAAPEGTPVQVIRPAAPFALAVVDLSAWPETEERELLALALAGEETARPFDLARGPVLRAVLLRLAPQDHVVALTMHHIASDGWSMGILVREVMALYAALAAGRPSPLTEPEVQYADFAVWQRSWLQGEVLEGEISFWRRQLAGLPPLLELPTDRPRPVVQSFRGSSRPLRLPAELTRQAGAFARREGATLFMVLLAGFQALLARYSGQEDLAVGSPIAGRNRVETEGLIGFFVNTLVLRGNLTGNPSFRELAGRTRETALAAYLHQDVPFEKLVEELAPERSLAQTPWFQVMLALQNAPLENLEIRGLRLRPVSVEVSTAKFDLTVSLAEQGGDLVGAVEYADALFDPATIDRLTSHFERLLTGLLAQADRCIGEVGLLTAEETHQLASWNATARDYPYACVHELFAEQAKRSPGAVAVTAGGEELTYGEIDLRSRRLARRLRRSGVGPGSRVGLCAEGLPERVVGMLGILAAGGAYVPLDSADPQDRLAFLLQDTGAGVLVTEESLARRLPVLEGLRVELLDRAGEGDPAAGPGLRLSPDAPAYVIYTSGSTGRPKGVVVPHRAIVRLVQGTDYVQLGPDDRVAQAASFSFDATTFEVWGALLNGGRVVGIEREALLAPGRLSETLRREGVTALFLTTALFNQIAREVPAGLASLRFLLFGGEQVDPAAVLAVLRAGPPAHLLHVYGPTETTTFATWHRVESVPPGETVPIGQPLANGTLHIVAAGLTAQPVGVPGELLLGGDGLAQGYHARPELTAERFVPDPQASAPGSRLYRTGDLVRRRPDGPVEFLGRLDGQVKIRGFRIEPGEIEEALRALPGVREAAVVAYEDRSAGGPGDRKLVAYVGGEADLTPGELRRSLRERLPDYMVPAAFVRLAALPLTPNGKVDRKALTVPEWQSGEESQRAPRTPVEQILAGIWGELLGRDRVGADESFFDLGGHSLLATRVMSRLRSSFGVEMPVRDLFEAPVLKDLAARVEAARRSASPAPPLVPVPRRGPLPLSFAQQRLWFIDQLEPGSSLYNMPVILRVEGLLDPGVLALILGEIVRRHEALRTVFAATEGSPVQVIRPAGPFPLPVVDLSDLPQTKRETLALTLTGDEAARPFDLSRGPLLRGMLLRLAQEDHAVALTMHHIASDGWSMGILVRELTALYPACAGGRPSPLPELAVQYADFAIWQRGWLQGEVLESEIGYWRRQLAGLPPELKLPADRPRPAVQSSRGAVRGVRLPEELPQRVQTLVRREGATAFMVLLAGFQALLSRYSGQQDLAVGSPIAGRNRLETEGLIGFFVNTLVLRADLSAGPTFRDLVGRVREAVLSAHTHQDVPFEKLVEELQPERSLAHSPLFQVMFTLNDAAERGIDIEGLRLRPFGAPGATAKFDLSLSVDGWGGEVEAASEYRTDLFDGPTIERLLHQFVRLVESGVDDAEQRVSALALLSAEERSQLLMEWNDTAEAFPRQLCLHDLFEAQAARTPEAVAVVAGSESLTYGALDARANQLACVLRRLGVAPERVAGICMERSVEMMVALFGVLKAGGAYLPLDPASPRERLELLLSDAGAVVLLTQERLLGHLGEAGVRTLCVDREPAGRFQDAEAHQEAPRPGPDNLAYLMYTSGSTGRPKGVLITHRSAVWYAVTAAGHYGIGPLDRFLQFASFSFDISVEEIFPVLYRGGTLVLTPQAMHLSTAHFLDRASEQGITALSPATAFWHELSAEVAARPGAFPPSIRLVIIGGERVLSEQVASWLRHVNPRVQLFNSYGPTETTVVATLFEIDSGYSGLDVPIGRPIRNARAVLLDHALALQPLGAAGELCIGGAGLARGYLGDPVQTALKLVPDPFGRSDRGARLYRTGDLARWRTDGTLEYLGRIDSQVKIRGFRIELGEIESALSALDGVREAVVVARERAGVRRLVAYVVGDVAGTAAGALRAALRERLPDYMVPADFVTLAALPLTPNGKVDRKALPAPERQRAEESLLAPRTLVEEVLAGIWAEVLGLERVGAADHFFDLGGHSLLATRVTSRLRSTFGVEMPLRDLFEAPVLADLAARVELARRNGAASPAPPLLPVPREGALPLSFAQQRLWFIDQLEPGSSLYNMPVALRVEGPLDSGVLALTLGEIVRRHEALRTVFAATSGSPVQVIQPAGTFLLPVVDLSELPQTEREAQALTLAGDEAARPFDLSRGPLLRGMLLRLAEEDHAAALTMHHIASDGWSMGILVREVAALYAAFAEGQPSPLPELTVQYADFAAWQSSWLHGETLEGEIAYWRRQLAGLPPLLELPTDRPRPAVQSYRGTTRPVRLSAELTRQAEALGRREGATLFMVLLAAFQALLARYSGQDDFAVGSPVAGRNRTEIEGLIGFFVNTLVLRGDLAGEPSFRELLGRVRETALASHTHQDVPFERLIEELAPERSLAHSPLFQVMLALQNTPAESLEIRDLRLRPVSMAGTTAKFDLTLSFSEAPDGLSGTAEYATDLFDPATMDLFLGRLVRLLSGATADPEVPFSELRLMDAEEERQLLQRGLDRSGRVWAHPVSVHDLFLQQAGRTPGRIATVGPQGALTYGELAERSAALAGRIRSILPRPLDRPVALLADADPPVLAGMIGILQAGAGFVPLDPRHPGERLSWTLQDAGCEVLVTQRRYLDRAERFGLRHVLCLEEALASGPVPAIRAASEPRALAYVVYTSGSTGRPKGVQVTHENLVPILLWGVEYLGLGATIRVLQSLSFCFDFGIFEHLTTLLAGGTLVFPGDAAGDPVAFAREIVRQGIDTLHTTPAFARELAVAGVDLDSLEVLHLGGEALSRDTVARLREAAPRAAVYNGYGPTEATVNSSIFRIGGADGSPWPIVPIGRPSADNALYILDRTGRPVPFGVRGDLHVGGIGVARGYRNRPELTAERFVPDPFGSVPGGRLYRTGDLVRYLPGGDIEFFGRLDQQVKIRGFRIELGEIEAALLALPGVQAAAVVVREDRREAGSGDRRLVAYWVGDATFEELRRSLRERLPDHMVPAAFVALAALPLTPNGKVDRRALPAPEPQSPEETYLAPRTLVEEVLAGIWAEVLGLDRIGVTDHFFDLGGHSLLATQVMSRLRSAFGIEMAVRDLFAAPVLADLAARVELARRNGAASPAPPLLPVPREGALPLSFAQQRLWFIDQLEPGSSLYNMPVALRVEGPLDSGVLALTLGEIVRRHEALRTVFAATGGSPVQVIQPAGTFLLPVVDLSELPQTEREAQALTLTGDEAARPFDLSRGPLLRGMLLRLAEEDHAAALTMHHIASDGWSMGILVREVVALYAAFAQGQPSPLPELTVQYADFAAWQSSWLHGETLEGEIAYWRRQLAGLPPLLELPTDRPRPAVQSHRGATRPVWLSAGLTRQVEALGRREGATLFMVLLAAFQALLARYSGQDDLAVGSPVAGRNRTEIEGLIGFFVNTLVLRGDLAGEPSFRELLGRVRETALASHAHQDVPFEKLVEELAPARSLAQTPLFQVMFVLQNAPAESLEIPGLRLRPVSGERTSAKFDLTLSLQEQDGEIAGAIEYAADHFDATTMVRLAGHFEQLLAAAVQQPGAPVLGLPLVGEAERFQVLVEWNDTGRVPAPQVCLHELFEAQARRTPDAVALVDGEREILYRELEEAAARLAVDLRRRGCGPEVVVGVRAERSAAMVVRLLAVLKAGAAYLPLDPQLPPARRDALLTGARAALVLGDEPWTSSAQGEARRQALHPEHLAYVLFTSGSTGTPKGVAVTHRSAVELVRWAGTMFSPGELSGVLASTSLSFDLSVFEIFAPLSWGGTVILASNVLALPKLPARDRVTLVNTVPSAMSELVRAGSLGPSIRTVNLAGEPLPRALANQVYAAGVERLWNLYGPSEDTTYSTFSRVPRHSSATPAIGRPVASTRAFVLAGLEAVPVGAPGELYLGGAGLARGYLHRPDLTAERFIPDPFASEPGSRLYRTGDLGRWTAAGELEFLGRLDQQVKIRGFRIELGEIEAALLAMPGVRSAAVVVREERREAGSGDRRLVAYWVGDATVEELRRSLRERLPDYMVPAAFVPLDALPLTSNGKVDRKALPAPEQQGAGASHVAPRTPTEEILARIWAELLGLERVGVAESFFDLGGHSLLGVQLMARIDRVFGVQLPIATLFAAPTVEQLARLLHGGETALRRSPLVRLHAGGAGRPLFVVHAVGGDVFSYVELAKALGSTRPVYGLQAVAAGNGHVPAMEELAAQYLRAVREVQPDGPYLLAGWSLGAVIAFEMAQQIERSGGKVALLAMLDPSSPWDGQSEGLDEASLLAGFAADLVQLSGRRVAFGQEVLAGLDVNEALDLMIELGRREGVLPPELDRPRLRERFDLFNRHMKALHGYRPLPYGGPATLFRAGASLPPGATDLTAGWNALTDAEVHLIEADHYSLLQRPALDGLVEHLQGKLAAAEDRC